MMPFDILVDPFFDRMMRLGTNQPQPTVDHSRLLSHKNYSKSQSMYTYLEHKKLKEMDTRIDKNHKKSAKIKGNNRHTSFKGFVQ